MNEMSLSQPRASIGESSRQWLSTFAHTYNISQRLAIATGRRNADVIGASEFHDAHWHDGGTACAVLPRAERLHDDASDTSSKPEAASVEQ